MDGRRRGRWADWAAAGVLLAGGVGFVVLAARLPALETLLFGYDWHNYWAMFQSGRPVYSGVDIFNPPWTILMLWPLAALPFRESWAVFTLLSLAILVGSLPRRPAGRLDLAAAGLLFSNYWVLRTLADGNLPAVVVAGCGLLWLGWRASSPAALAAGVLLVTAKYQESWLVVGGLGVLVLKTWPARRWAPAVLLILALAGPSLIWLGADWFHNLFPAAALSGAVDRMHSNITLLAALRRAGWPASAQIALWAGVLAVTLVSVSRRPRAFSRGRLGLWVAASLLLAPYATGSSLTTLWAAAVLPLARTHWALAVLSAAVGWGPFLTGLLGGGSGWPDDALTVILAGVWLVQVVRDLREAEPQ